MRIKLAATLALTTLTTVGALLAVGASPAAAAEPADITALAISGEATNNIDTFGFAKSSGGVSLDYSCDRASGNISDTQVQLVNLNETVAYRTFPATCDGKSHSIENLNVASNTAMRARLHVYSAGRITGWVQATCYGYYV